MRRVVVAVALGFLPVTPLAARADTTLTAPTPTPSTPTSSTPSPEGSISTTLALDVAATVKDLSPLTFTATWRADGGAAVTGQVVLQYQTQTSSWRDVASVDVVGGTGTVELTPRDNGRYRLVGGPVGTYGAAASSRRGLQVLPTGDPVVLPKDAPRPLVKLPAQPRWNRVAADPKITMVSKGAWRHMVGRSWHRGCPVGRGDLRLLAVSYWGYDGYVRRGSIVLHKSVVRRAAAAFTDMFNGRYPIRSMYPVDRFGWSTELRGANDRTSMAAGNTSGFNCRSVVGQRGIRSPHAYGRAIDLNTWENPFASAGGWVPNAWWVMRRSPANVVYRSRNNPVVKILASHGFRWSYGIFDSQHFDG